MVMMLVAAVATEGIAIQRRGEGERHTPYSLYMMMACLGDLLFLCEKVALCVLWL
jgi:hypothetical protein